jgi:hypothetical protein
MISRLLVPVALAATLLPGAAAHAVDTGGGLSCGLDSSNDITGLALPSLDDQAGVVYGGPVAVANKTGVLSLFTELDCTVWLNGAGLHSGIGATYGTGIAINVPGNAVALPPFPVTYTPVTPGTNVWLCTAMRFNTIKGPRTYQYDADPATPGNQCALAITVNAGNLRQVAVVPAEFTF